MPDEHLKKQLYLLHAATGYCSTRNLVLALKKRGASSPVSKAAEEFQCTICAEKQKLNGKHAATLEPLPPKWAMLSADGGHWTHNETKETVGFAVLIDEGSRFRTAKVLCRGKKQTLNASVYSVLKRELDAILWKTHNISVASCRCFPPKQSWSILRCWIHIFRLDMIPAEAHWKFGICEQAVRGLKEVMSKLVMNEPSITPEDALSTAVASL